MTKPEISRHHATVADAAKGARLDKFLADTLPEYSRSRLKGLIEEGHVRVSGETIAEPAYRVKRGQTLVVTVPPAHDDGVPEAQAMALNVIYEDAELIVIDKPAGLVVHPAAGNPDRTLVNALLAHCGESLSGIGGVRRPGIVHRLDKDTSGLMVAAKTDRAHHGLAAQLADRTLGRTYQAVVWGMPNPAAGTITGNIGRSPRNRKKMAIVEKGGKAARTNYRTLASIRNGLWSHVECRLETGRTHQIRVHMAARGHPLVGDALYGGTRARADAKSDPRVKEAMLACPRQALHAVRLRLIHPVSGAEMSFESPLPDDIAALLK